MVQVLLSKYCAEANSRNSLSKDEKAIWTSGKDKKAEVTIDSFLMSHVEATGDGLGYECIFYDDGSRCFTSGSRRKKEAQSGKATSTIKGFGRVK